MTIDRMPHGYDQKTLDNDGNDYLNRDKFEVKFVRGHSDISQSAFINEDFVNISQLAAYTKRVDEVEFMLNDFKDHLDKNDKHYKTLRVAQILSGCSLVGIIIFSLLFDNITGIYGNDSSVVGAILGILLGIVYILWARFK